MTRQGKAHPPATKWGHDLLVVEGFVDAAEVLAIMSLI